MTFTEPYIIVDEFGVKNANDELVSGIFKNVQEALALPVLNYQYGYLRELNETLKQYTTTDEFQLKKFPMIWLQQPFTIRKDTTAITYGTIESMNIFICAETDQNLKAAKRMELKFKPILYPIYYELMNQIDYSLSFLTQSPNQIEHSLVDRYYWGDGDVFESKIDCIMLNIRALDIANKTCLPFKSF